MLAFKGYAAVLIWIQLWPPLYAILNYMASIYAAYDLAAAADLGTGGKALALQNRLDDLFAGDLGRGRRRLPRHQHSFHCLGGPEAHGELRDCPGRWLVGPARR
jgi:hypothetical protein